MTPDRVELGFDAWVLLPNVLNTLLRGAAGHAEAALQAHRPALLALDELLGPVPPERMLQVLSGLPVETRALLVQATELCLRGAGTEAQALLGTPADAAGRVLAWLRSA